MKAVFVGSTEMEYDAERDRLLPILEASLAFHGGDLPDESLHGTFAGHTAEGRGHRAGMYLVVEDALADRLAAASAEVYDMTQVCVPCVCR